MLNRFRNRTIIIAICLVFLVLGLTVYFISGSSDTGIDPYEYDTTRNYLWDYVNSEEYMNADIDTRIQMFNDELLAIGENGIPNHRYPLVNIESITMDNDNKVIRFIDCYDKWVSFDFQNSGFGRCTVDDVLFAFVRSDSYRTADIELQVELFCDELIRLSDNPEMVNPPFINLASVEMDNNGLVVYYCLQGETYKNHYSFLAQSFTEIITPTPSEM